MATACFSDSNGEISLDKRKSYHRILDEKRVGHLFFTWTIENFHLMPEDGHKFIVSPSFQVASVPSAWFLTFFPYYNLRDRKCAKIDIFRRNIDETCGPITATYRTGVRISDVDTWFQEKRETLLGVNDYSSTIIYTRNFFSRDNFHQNTMIILCEMYLSQVTTEENYWEKNLSLETMDLLRLSSDMSRVTAKSKESDVIIRVKDLKIHSHKAILSARSAVFSRLLKDESSYLRLKDEDFEHIFLILSYIYSGCLSYVAKKRLRIGLYECAERYSIKGLKDLLIPMKISGRTSITVERINFTWTIEQFSTLPLRMNECMISPLFNNGRKNKSVWYLELYPRGRLQTPNSIGIFLKNTEVRDALHISIQISILDKYSSERFKKCIDKIWIPLSVYEFPKFIDMDMMKSDILLENDTLTLNCKIELRVPSAFLDKTSLICHSSLAEHVGFELLSNDLENLFYSDAYRDVTIVMEDGLIRFHKVILIARSPVFARRIRKNNGECVIGVTNVLADIFDNMIFYLYTGKLRKLTTATAIQLYEAAKMFDVECLANRCIRVLLKDLNIECFRDIFFFTYKHKDKKLMTACSIFFKHNQEQIVATIDWENFSITKSDFLSKISTWLPQPGNAVQCSSEQ